jgi:hypothetical protein
MKTFIAIEKHPDNKGNILGYTLQEYPNGAICTVSGDKVKREIKRNSIRVINLTLTSDNRLLFNNTALQKFQDQQLSKYKDRLNEIDHVLDLIFTKSFGTRKFKENNIQARVKAVNTNTNIVTIVFTEGADCRYRFAYRVVPRENVCNYAGYFYDIQIKSLDLCIKGKTLGLNQYEEGVYLGNYLASYNPDSFRPLPNGSVEELTAMITNLKSSIYYDIQNECFTMRSVVLDKQELKNLGSVVSSIMFIYVYNTLFNIKELIKEKLGDTYGTLNDTTWDARKIIEEFMKLLDVIFNISKFLSYLTSAIA